MCTPICMIERASYSTLIRIGESYHRTVLCTFVCMNGHRLAIGKERNMCQNLLHKRPFLTIRRQCLPLSASSSLLVKSRPLGTLPRPPPPQHVHLLSSLRLLLLLLRPPISKSSHRFRRPPPMSQPRNHPTSLSSSSFTPQNFLKLQATVTIFRPSKPQLSFRTLCSHSSSSPTPPPESNETPNLISLLHAVPDWADGVKERGMRKKRSLYNHEKWVEHRSSHRHLRHVLSSLSSRVILSLIPPVIAFTSVAAVIAGYNSAVESHFLPEFFPLLRASSLPYQLTAPALALLLVFRTEASYSRFEEGRKAWTKVISGSNDFARQVIADVDGSRDAALKTALLQYITAFPVALKCHLIYGSDFGQDLRNLLEVGDLTVVLNSRHRPRCIIEFISQSLRLLNLEDSKRNTLESKISCFHEGISVCEQLMGIPIPLSYTRLTSRFLVLWHLTLPVILWDDCHWIVVPATFISAASLFCIEEVGVLIEEPFPMLALDELCNLVRSNIQEAITSEKVIQERLIMKRNTQSCRHSTNGRPSA